MPLTDVAVRAAKPREKSCKLADGQRISRWIRCKWLQRQKGDRMQSISRWWVSIQGEVLGGVVRGAPTRYASYSHAKSSAFERIKLVEVWQHRVRKALKTDDYHQREADQAASISESTKRTIHVQKYAGVWRRDWARFQR